MVSLQTWGQASKKQLAPSSSSSWLCYVTICSSPSRHSYPKIHYLVFKKFWLPAPLPLNLLQSKNLVCVHPPPRSQERCFNHPQQSVYVATVQPLPTPPHPRLRLCSLPTLHHRGGPWESSRTINLPVDLTVSPTAEEWVPNPWVVAHPGVVWQNTTQRNLGLALSQNWVWWAEAAHLLRAGTEGWHSKWWRSLVFVQGDFWLGPHF